MPSDTVDIAIIGCGVSGAATATKCAQEGAIVAILEEHADVGRPAHCSGHVGIPAFRKFAPKIPRRIIENEIKGAVFHAPNGATLTLQRAEPVTWVLNRAAFDVHIARVAKENGARILLNSRAERYTRLDDGTFQLKIHGRKKQSLRCRIIVDASGCGGSVSKYAGLPQPRRSMLVNSAQFSADNLRDVDPDLVEVYFGQDYAPGFFGWIIPRRDGSAKVGIAAGARANVRKCFERFTRKHPVVSWKLKRAKVLSPTMYHPIPIGGAAKRTYSEGILTVGDAASQVKPTTGGGIVLGLACGQLAGQTCAEAIEAGDTSARKLSEYDAAWRRLFGFDLAAMSWLRRLLYRLPDKSLNGIFDISNEFRVNEILSRTADIDFQGRTLLSLSRDPRLFLALLSASILSAPTLFEGHRRRTGA